jgi:hypothetical protein
MAAWGQAPLPDVRITSLAQNGQLTFTVLSGYTNYVVEWAPTVAGPRSGSWENLQGSAGQRVHLGADARLPV